MATIPANDPLPIPRSAADLPGALADLAGAVNAAIGMNFANNPNSVVTDEWLVLYAAFGQWQNSGFVAREAESVRDTILKTFHYEHAPK